MCWRTPMCARTTCWTTTCRVWVPIPPLAEIQVALEEAVAEVTGLSGYDLKRIMRTGTVATIDNRNWELRDQRGPVQRLSQSRAIALDMESATIAANGFRFRVPYGTLLCVSDKPLHGEMKLPGMATEFYKRQVAQHLTIGIRAMEKLRRDADGAAAFAQAQKLFGDGVPVDARLRRAFRHLDWAAFLPISKLDHDGTRSKHAKHDGFGSIRRNDRHLGPAGGRVFRNAASGLRFLRPFPRPSCRADGASARCRCSPPRFACRRRRHSSWPWLRLPPRRARCLCRACGRSRRHTKPGPPTSRSIACCR